MHKKIFYMLNFIMFLSFFTLTYLMLNSNFYVDITSFFKGGGYLLLIFLLFIFIFNLIYINFLSTGVYFLVNGLDNTYAYVLLLLKKKIIKRSFDIEFLIKVALMKRDNKTLLELFDYLKDKKVNVKIIVKLYSALFALREYKRANELLKNYEGESNYKWLKYIKIYYRLEDNNKLELISNDLLEKFKRDPIFCVYYYYILKIKDPIQAESLKKEINNFYKKETLSRKHKNLVNNNLFFTVFCFIYFEAIRDIFDNDKLLNI